MQELYVLNDANVELLQFDFWGVDGGKDMFIADKNFFKKRRTPPGPKYHQLWKLRIREKDDSEDDDIHVAHIQHATFVKWVSNDELKAMKRGKWR